MVVRYKPFAALAAVLAPAAAAHGSAIVIPPNPIKPIFQCNAVGSTIDWGDGYSVMPYLGFAPDAAAAADISNVSFNPMDCAGGDGGNNFSDPLAVFDKQKQQDLKYFEVKLDQVFVSSVQLSDFHFEIKIDKSTPTLKVVEDPGGTEIKFWDVLVDVLKIDSAGNTTEHKDFIGLKTEAPAGSVGDLGLKLDDGGNLLLDPSFTAGGNVSLYAAPVATPEPGTLVMLGTGLLGIGSLVRRRLGW